MKSNTLKEFKLIRKFYRTNTHLIFILSYLLFTSVQVEGQYTQVNYTQILSENGLSQNTVHKILQDKDGFMWFATEDGLNKYDGYNFIVYKNNLQDKNSISDNFIWTIYEDRQGILWIGTNSGGLCKFDKETERFISFKNDPHNPNSISLNNVRTIFEDREGYLWVGTENGLNKFDRKNNKFFRYLHNPSDSNSLSNNVVLAIYEDNDGEIWIGSDGGLDRYNRKNNNFFNYSSEPDNDYSLSNNVVLSIYQDKAGIFWIGTLKGLTMFDKKRGTFSRYFVKPSEANSINSNRISLIFEDKADILWVGTGDGLFQFDRKIKAFKNIKPSFSGSNILNNNNILSLYEDNSGLLWIGTAEDGIVKYDRERIKFRHFKHDLFNPNSLNHNTIRALYQDEDNLLWIGTLGGGLNCYDIEKNKFIYYKNSPSDPYSLSDNSISSVFKDDEDYLWVGTWGGGLNRSLEPYNKSNYQRIKFINYKQGNSTQSLSNNIIQAIIQDSKGRIWIGTGLGLDLFDKKRNKFINFTNNPDNKNSLSSNQVQSSLLQDNEGNLWIGTWNGLNKIPADVMNNDNIDPASVKFTIFRFNSQSKNSISDERVISSYKDAKGNLWFGTYGGGLNKYYIDENSNGSFIYYTINDGLSSNIIYSIQGDDNGNLWLSTDNGLSMFNPEEKIFRNYDATDGLQGNQFFWGASFKGKNGDLFFGGTNGFNIFNPKELKNNRHIPPVVITNFQIFNKPVEIKSEDSPLKKSITFTEEIELSYNENVFSFEFSSLDFTVPSKNRYAYMMEGFDNDWVYSGERRFVTYTNLDPGEYIFRVKGTNNDGVWNEKGASVVIRILPPLWKSWWFIISALLLIGGIIALMIYFRVKHLLDIERLRTKLAADLHDNIGSSLTEISILSEVISTKIKTEDNDIIKSLNMISAGSRNLIDNMSDIVWLVNPKRDSLYDLILRLRDTYSELSSYTNISFRSENIKSLEKVSLSMEHRQHLYLIFKEAINNCITHSGCTEITLDATVRGSSLVMTLKDNGKGFKLNGSFNGNGLGNIKTRAESIGGRLIILSNPGEGTTVKFEGNIL